MGPTTFSKHYCVCIQEDGTPRELTRLGSVVTYKAIDYRSGHPVALQVIPLTSVDQAAREQFEEQARAAQKLDHINNSKVFDVGVEDEHIVFITEYLQGETAEAWIVAHGTMAPDAVVRIGLQVISALAAAMFHGLTHRSIQPSNLMIVPGTNPEGEWPFVKLLNFGLAGLKLYSEGNEPRELIPTIAPQFASPEQLQHGTVDFRSEIFSLGATMCFLLTGAVPLAGIPNENGVAERELPSVRKIPRSVRKVLRRMLRYNPEERPQDPVVFAEELRKCLQKVESRQGARHFGAPLAADVPSKVERPRNRVVVTGLALAALLIALAAATAVLIPSRLQSLLHRQRELSTIGVPVGVPDSTPPASGQTPPSVTTGQTATVIAPAVAGTNQPVSDGTPESNPGAVTAGQNRLPSPVVAAQNSAAIGQQLPFPAAAPTLQPAPPTGSAETKNAPPQIAASDRVREPPPPAEGPDVSPLSAANRSEDQQPANAPADKKESRSESERTQIQTPQDVWHNLQSNSDRAVATSSPASTAKATSEKKAISAKRNVSKSRRQATLPGRRLSTPPMRVGSMRAEFVGVTEDGSWILQLPNGRTVVTPPVPNPDEVPIEKHRRVRRVVTPPREVPFDQRPPVVVLPPDT
jgi:serine/threonine protein kinase